MQEHHDKDVRRESAALAVSRGCVRMPGRHVPREATVALVSAVRDTERYVSAFALAGLAQLSKLGDAVAMDQLMLEVTRSRWCGSTDEKHPF